MPGARVRVSSGFLRRLRDFVWLLGHNYFAAFPDLTHTVEDVIAEGDKVVTRYTIRGTHNGATEDFGPPTGRQIELEGISIHRFQDGKIVEEWEQYDNLSVLQQLGLAPEE